MQNGDQEIVNLLVAYQADINSPNYRRVTPLAVACKLQDWQMVNHLLDKQVRKHILHVVKCAPHNIHTPWYPLHRGRSPTRISLGNKHHPSHGMSHHNTSTLQ